MTLLATMVKERVDAIGDGDRAARERKRRDLEVALPQRKRSAGAQRVALKGDLERHGHCAAHAVQIELAREADVEGPVLPRGGRHRPALERDGRVLACLQHVIAQRCVDLRSNVVITLFDRAQGVGPHRQLERRRDRLARHEVHLTAVVTDLQLVVVTEHR